MQLNANLPLPAGPATARARMQGAGVEELRGAGERAGLGQATQAFETLLLEQMFQAMREAVPESTLLPESRGREIFREFLDGEYARLMERRGGIGLARFMAERLPAAGQDGAPARQTAPPGPERPGVPAAHLSAPEPPVGDLRGRLLKDRLSFWPRAR